MATLETRKGPLILNIPDSVTRRMAEDAANYLVGLRNVNGRIARIVGFVSSDGAEDPTTVMLPQLALDLITKLLTELGQGHAVSVETVEAELTPGQAAEVLSVDRQYLVDLLNEGEIPYRKVGSHRQISLTALLDFKRRNDDYRREIANRPNWRSRIHLSGTGHEGGIVTGSQTRERGITYGGKVTAIVEAGEAAQVASAKEVVSDEAQEALASAGVAPGFMSGC